MMSSTCEDPCFCTCCKVRLRCPECSCHRKFRHGFFHLFTVYIIYDQAETVTEIYQRSCHCRTCLRCINKTCRILSVSHGKRTHLDTNGTFCHCRANFKHMGLQDAFFSRYKIVCIIFHKGGTLRILNTGCHDLHQSYHCCSLPVTFCTESVSLFHQSLDSKSRKLFQRTKVTEMRYNCVIISFLKEFFETDFNGCLYCNVLSEFLRISSFQNNIIFAVILFYQCIDLILRYC